MTRIYLLLSVLSDPDPSDFSTIASELTTSTGTTARAVVHDARILSGLAHGAETDNAPPFAGLIELDAEDPSSELFRSVAKILDAAPWIDAAKSSIVVGSEFTVVAGDEPIVLAMALTRREGMSADEFLDYWRTTHADLGRQVPGSEGYRQIHLDEPLTETARQLCGFAGPQFDGIALACYSTDAAFRSVLANAEVAGPLLEDERNFINHDRSAMIIGRI